MDDWKERPTRNLPKLSVVERVMEEIRYSWSGESVDQLGSMLRTRGFDLKEQELPNPEMKIAFRERVEAKADKCRVFLDPNTARLTCQKELTERDRELERLPETEYPAILVLAAASALRLLR